MSDKKQKTMQEAINAAYRAVLFDDKDAALDWLGPLVPEKVKYQARREVRLWHIMNKQVND